MYKISIFVFGMMVTTGVWAEPPTMSNIDPLAKRDTDIETVILCKGEAYDLYYGLVGDDGMVGPTVRAVLISPNGKKIGIGWAAMKLFDEPVTTDPDRIEFQLRGWVHRLNLFLSYLCDGSSETPEEAIMRILDERVILELDRFRYKEAN